MKFLLNGQNVEENFSNFLVVRTRKSIVTRYAIIAHVLLREKYWILDLIIYYVSLC